VVREVKMMDKRLLGVAFIGGILMLVAVFGDYGFPIVNSLWDVHDTGILTSAILVIFGVVAVAGLGMQSIGATIPVGGFLALISGIQHYRMLSALPNLAEAHVGYAIWLVIVGGILAIIGTFGLRGPPPKVRW